MSVNRRASARLAVVAAVLALVAVGSTASSASASSGVTANGAAGGKLVEFVRPTPDTLVQWGTGSIRVIVHLRAGARLKKVEVDGIVVTRTLRAGPRGYYRGLLGFNPHLHYGYNNAFAEAVGSSGHEATAHVRFIVAQRDNSLLRLTSFRTDTTMAPLQVGLRDATGTPVRAILSAAQGVSARVYVNNRRVDRGFSLQGRQLIVALGAGEGVRYGRNLVQILVHITHPYKHQSRYDLESRTVYIRRNAPIASAGPDSRVTQHGLARFNSRATKLPPGWTRPTFRWRIISAPRGSKARLRNTSGSRPTLVPNRPGIYQVRVSVRAHRPGTGRGVASVAVAGASGLSNDTATVTASPDLPPEGPQLDTMTDNAGILLGGRPVRGTEACTVGFICSKINYLVLNRTTLTPVASGNVFAIPEGMNYLDTLINGYSGSLDYLVVLNWVSFVPFETGDADALNTLLQKIGADPLTAAQRARVIDDGGTERFPGSAVGVAGAPAGSAFVTFGYDAGCERSCGQIGLRGGLSGYLRLNTEVKKYDFVFADAVDFDTEPNQTVTVGDKTTTDTSPSQLTITVGDKAYTQANPGSGVSGFHLLVLNAKTLEPMREAVYSTNGANNGPMNVAEVQRLTTDLKAAADNPDRPLVILQAFGTPHGDYLTGYWDAAAKQIERLGGNRQVFNAMNPVDVRPLNDEGPPKANGPYAFIGRADSTAPLAESSVSLDGQPGRLRGVLTRSHDGGYEPTLAAPPLADGRSRVNEQLIHIADQAPVAFPAFTVTLPDNTQQPIDAATVQAVQKYLGGPTVTRFCSPAANVSEKQWITDKTSVCDIRKQYYEQYEGNSWTQTGLDLRDTATCADPAKLLTAVSDPANAPLGPDVEESVPLQDLGFTVAQCQAISAQLAHEVGLVAQIRNYFDTLKKPFVEGGALTLADLTQTANTIRNAVSPPPADKTVSNLFTGISYALRVGGVSPVISTLSGAFSAAGYFTQPNGAPNLIDGQITTAASNLGVELADRYLQAGANLDDLAELIVSDYGKLSQVAARSTSDPAWKLDTMDAAQAQLRLASRQTIWQTLIPLAYPVMYDLGDAPSANAWYCSGDFGLGSFVDKYLFENQAQGAQFVGRFGGWNPIIAVAQARAVGSLKGAVILGVSPDFTNVIFGSVAKGGLGLNKLEFYSPRNGFRYFPANPGFPALADIVGSDAVGSLVWHPYNTSDFPGRVINCADVPDPPGNSG